MNIFLVNKSTWIYFKSNDDGQVGELVRKTASVTGNLLYLGTEIAQVIP